LATGNTCASVEHAHARGTPLAECARIMRVLALVLIAGCKLGGTGLPPGETVDAGIGASQCAATMANAPLAPADYSFEDALTAAPQNTWDATTPPVPGDPHYPGGHYRSLDPDSQGKTHPGCTVDGLAYTPASIAGYACAARDFPFPDGVVEDTTKPIVILIHGNSDTPDGWMPYVSPNPSSLGFPADSVARDQLGELLPAQGFRTIAVDMRTDKVDDPPSPENQDTGNTPLNEDHGWTVPIAEALIKAVATAYPNRQLDLIGFSLGATVQRDALRRLWVEWVNGTWDVNILSRVDHLIVASGANHGVSSFSECGANLTMRGTVTCEMGQRNQYTQTVFHRPLNGPPITSDAGGWWETPCADGDYAFGKRAACGNHTVAYTTITMKDLPDGTQQDEFVSESSSALNPPQCADNELDELTDFDTSGYFYNGYFRNHFGSARSAAGLMKILATLEN
jgi:pimeloyl-ACP methyl ester carboxylesterase